MRRAIVITTIALIMVSAMLLRAAFAQDTTPFPTPAHLRGVDLRKQTKAQADIKIVGCIHCHQNTGDPHEKGTVNLGCCDCHGGDPSTGIKERAHVLPRFPDAWRTSGN